MHLKPARSRVVIDPATGQPLPENGAKVEPTQYWLRPIADGDVTEAKPSKEKK